MKKRKPLTKAQKDAQRKNWLIFRLHGCLNLLAHKDIETLSTKAYVNANRASVCIKDIIKEIK